MIDMTERQVAEEKIEVVKNALKESNADYYMCETPFSLSINIRKKFIKDFSPKIISPTSSFSQTSISRCDSSLMHSSPNDSGLSTKSTSFLNMEKTLEDAQKEILEIKLQSNRKIESLQKDLVTKDSAINQLNSKITSVEDTSKNIKNELKMKNEQIKQQKGSAENFRQKLEKANIEKETLKTNLYKNISTLEDKNKELSSTLKKTISELDNQRKEFDKVNDDLKSIKQKQLAAKPQQSQTENLIFKSTEVQTMNEEKNYIDIGIQTEINISFKKSSLPPRTADCTSCYGQHLIDQTSSWPKTQYRFSKFIPASSEQREWPDKQLVDFYVKDFGDHNCEDCVKDEAPWKKTTCDNLGECSTSSVYVCKHNLVEFGGLRWWERMGLPRK